MQRPSLWCGRSFRLGCVGTCRQFDLGLGLSCDFHGVGEGIADLQLILTERRAIERPALGATIEGDSIACDVIGGHVKGGDLVSVGVHDHDVGGTKGAAVNEHLVALHCRVGNRWVANDDRARCGRQDDQLRLVGLDIESLAGLNNGRGKGHERRGGRDEQRCMITHADKPFGSNKARDCARIHGRQWHGNGESSVTMTLTDALRARCVKFLLPPPQG